MRAGFWNGGRSFSERISSFQTSAAATHTEKAYICELRRVHIAFWKVITVAEQTAAKLEVGERARG